MVKSFQTKPPTRSIRTGLKSDHVAPPLGVKPIPSEQGLTLRLLCAPAKLFTWIIHASRLRIHSNQTFRKGFRNLFFSLSVLVRSQAAALWAARRSMLVRADFFVFYLAWITMAQLLAQEENENAALKGKIVTRLHECTSYYKNETPLFSCFSYAFPSYLLMYCFAISSSLEPVLLVQTCPVFSVASLLRFVIQDRLRRADEERRTSAHLPRNLGGVWVRV